MFWTHLSIVYLILLVLPTSNVFIIWLQSFSNFNYKIWENAHHSFPVLSDQQAKIHRYYICHWVKQIQNIEHVCMSLKPKMIWAFLLLNLSFKRSNIRIIFLKLKKISKLVLAPTETHTFGLLYSLKMVKKNLIRWTLFMNQFLKNSSYLIYNNLSPPPPEQKENKNLHSNCCT